MNIRIYRNGATPIYQQIANYFKEKILNNELVEGFKLPSERELAGQLKVHRNTIIKAYTELINSDLVTVSNSPRGYFVSHIISGISYGKDIERTRYFSPLNYMVRDEFLTMNNMFNNLYRSGFDKDLISFAMDLISPEVYPKKQLNEILRDLMADEKCDLYGFCDSQGTDALRSSLVRLLQRRNIKVSKNEIQVVAENYSVLGNLIKLFVPPGSVIIAEEPILPDIPQFFQLFGVRLITVPMDVNGMRMDYLESLVAKYNPKFIYTIPTFHFPSGISMSLQRRYELLDISYRYNVPVIEEDCDSVLRYDGPALPSLKALDKGENVIYINSFIATICPGVRVAYVVAPSKTVEKISRLVGINEIFVNSIGQYLVSEFLNRNYFDSHVKYLCTHLKAKRNLMCSEILKNQDSLKLDFKTPEGGTSLWCELDRGINQHRLLRNASKLGVIFTPGHVFYPYGEQGENRLRLCYGNASDEEIIKGIRLLSQAAEM